MLKRFPFKRINDFLAEVGDTFDNINYGGCGVMAAILARRLAPFVPEMKIVTCDWCTDKSVDDARPRVKENTVYSWNAQGIYFNHVWVEFKWNGRWYVVDVEGIRSRRRMYARWGAPFQGSFTLHEIEQISGNKRGWNCSFDRNQILAMKLMARKGFAKIFS